MITNWIVKPISFIFNLSFKNGYLSQDLGCADILPMHKKGDRSVVSIYRPICNCSLIAKIFERAFFGIMRKYLLKKNTFVIQTRKRIPKRVLDRVTKAFLCSASFFSCLRKLLFFDINFEIYLDKR